MAPTDASLGLDAGVARAGARRGGAGRRAPGRVEKIDFASTVRPGAKAALHVYLPAGYDASAGRHPVAYVLDGDAAREKGLVPRSLDHLMPEKVTPALVVFLGRFDWGASKPQAGGGVESGARAAREGDRAPGRRALPDGRGARGAGRRRALLRRTGSRWRAGVRRQPACSAPLGLQSAAMLDTDEVELYLLLRRAADRPLRVYQDWGRYDAHATREHWDMRITNARVNARLREKGYQPAGGEAPDGVGWGSWRNRTDRLFEALFPPAPR